MDIENCIDSNGSLHDDNKDAAYENGLNLKLDKEWIQKAELELGETMNTRANALKQVRELILADKTLPSIRQDDAFLLRFLRAKKFDVDKSFKMMQKYFKMKNDSPDLFKVSPITEMYDILGRQIQQMLSHRDNNGQIIYIFRVQNCDPYKCAVNKVFRSNVLSLENAIRDPCTQIGGLTVLLDMTGVGFAHAKFLSPHLAKRTVEVVQEAFPMRFKAFHILHEPFYFDAILAVLRPFLKEKIRKRIVTHGSDLSSLHRHISKEILPIEYGGTQESFNNTKWREQIIRDEDYFLRLETYSNDAQISTKTISRNYSNENVKTEQSMDACNKLEAKMTTGNDGENKYSGGIK